MNKNADTWVAALLGGEYAQGKGALTKVDDEGGKQYCCLGVACDLYQKETGGLVVKDTGDGVLTYDGSIGTLPGEVREWLGLEDVSGEFGEDGSLAGLNDAGLHFRHIANIIAAQPMGLFTEAPVAA